MISGNKSDVVHILCMLLIWRICVLFAHKFGVKMERKKKECRHWPDVESLLPAGDVATGRLVEEPVGDVGRVVHTEPDTDDE